MSKITGYKLVSGKDSAELIRNVTALLNEGWQPLGACAVTVIGPPDRQQIVLTQTMARGE